MTNDRSDSELRIRLRVIEVVVLDVFIGTIPLSECQKEPIDTASKHTVAYCPPDRIAVMERAMEGFSATHSTLISTGMLG